MTNISL